MNDQPRHDPPAEPAAAPRQPDGAPIPIVERLDTEAYPPGSDAARCPDIMAVEPRASVDEHLHPQVLLWATFADGTERPIGTLTPYQSRQHGLEYLTAGTHATREAATMRYLMDTMPIGLRAAVDAVTGIIAVEQGRWAWRTDLLASRVEAFRSPGGYADTPVRCLTCHTVLEVYAYVQHGTDAARVELGACGGCGHPRHWVCARCGRPGEGWQGDGWIDPCTACKPGERLAPVDAPQGQA